MIDTESDLLASIIANHADDVRRLVYADWCEENGEPERAEFIRVQCELACHCAALSPPDGTGNRSALLCPACTRDLLQPEQTKALRRRERELFSRGDDLADWTFERSEGIPPRWLRGLEFDDIGKPQAVYRRGFVELVRCSWFDWLTHHVAIMAVMPLREVRLTTWPPYSWVCERMQHTWTRIEENTHETIVTTLAAEWPSITFHLPERNHRIIDGFHRVSL